MSVSYSPKIVYDSLNLSLDFANANSWSSSQALTDQMRNYTVALSGTNFLYPYQGLTINNVNDSYVNVTTASSLRMGTSNFTMGAWVKQNDTGANIITESRGTSLLGYFFVLNYPSAGQMSVFLNYTAVSQNVYTITPTIALTTSTAQYLVASINRNANTINFYVNGQVAGSSSIDHFSSISPSSGDLYRLGYDLGGSTTNMTFYNYHHYNKALTSTEVLQNFNALRGRFGV